MRSVGFNVAMALPVSACHWNAGGCIVDSKRYIAQVVAAYRHTKKIVIAKGYAREIKKYTEIHPDRIPEEIFLYEAAWVILSSWFREAVVRKMIKDISAAFLDWSSAAKICSNRDSCREKALAVFGNRKKIDAILKVAEIVATEGYEVVRRRIKEEKISYLKTLPYIGKITSFHLARNLGLDVARPGRHLQRIAEAMEFSSPQDMCELISSHVGDRVGVVDVVLWRYATLEPQNYLAVFAAVQAPK